MVGCGNQHNVNVLTVQYTAKILHITGLFASLLLANFKSLGEHGIIHVAQNGAIDFRVEEETFEIPTAHPSATDQAQPDLFIRAGFAGPSDAEKRRGDSSQSQSGGQG
jgi:hypothetical protein